MTPEKREQRRKYNKERYNWLKEHKICVNCGQQEAFGRYVRCPDCLEKQRLSHEKYNHSEKGIAKNKEHNEKDKVIRRTRYHERKENGLCISCGKPICQESKRFCLEHLLQNRRYWREINRKRRARDPRTLDELRQQRSEVSRRGVRKTHQTKGWYDWVHRKRPFWDFRSHK